MSDPNVQHSKTTETPNMEWDIDNLPNRLTIFRLILVPVVVAALMFNLDFFEVSSELKSTLGWTAAWIFVVASITDFFDGYIARKRQIVTPRSSKP